MRADSSGGRPHPTREQTGDAMSLHLFSTPVQCAQCGTMVDDPKVDHCPNCNSLLKERRTPRRLAGVEKRYGNLRFLMGAMRFLAVMSLLIGVLGFIFGLGDDDISTLGNAIVLGGSVVLAVALFALASFFELALDVEENTRAAFRVQQLLLEQLQEGRATTAAGTAPASPTAGVDVVQPAQH